MSEKGERFRVVRRPIDTPDNSAKRTEGDFVNPKLCVLTPGQTRHLSEKKPDTKRRLRILLPRMGGLLFQTNDVRIESSTPKKRSGPENTEYYVQLYPNDITKNQMNLDVDYLYEELQVDPPHLYVVQQFTVAKFFDHAAADNRAEQLSIEKPLYELGLPVIQYLR